MNNATEYRRKNVIGTGKRINFFIRKVITADERARVITRQGHREAGTLMPDDVFSKFKEWITQDKRFRNYDS